MVGEIIGGCLQALGHGYCSLCMVVGLPSLPKMQVGAISSTIIWEELRFCQCFMTHCRAFWFTRNTLIACWSSCVKHFQWKMKKMQFG